MKKAVSFKSNEVDQRILEYVNTKMNFSAYVKELILKDMETKDIQPLTKTVIQKEQIKVNKYIKNDTNEEIEWE